MVFALLISTITAIIVIPIDSTSHHRDLGVLFFFLKMSHGLTLQQY